MVICAIQSIFKKHQSENKRKFKKYKQIYLKVDEIIFKKRKFKLSRYKKNVVGKDIVFPKPVNSDLEVQMILKTLN